MPALRVWLALFQVYNDLAAKLGEGQSTRKSERG